MEPQFEQRDSIDTTRIYKATVVRVEAVFKLKTNPYQAVTGL